MDRGAAVLLTAFTGGLVALQAPINSLLGRAIGTWAAATQLTAWGVQWIACYVLLVALGLDEQAGLGAAAAVLFAVNVTAALPAMAHAQAEDDPVVIDHANELRRVVEGDSLTYFLEGAVRAHRGPIQMRSEIATIFRHSQVADFQRNVHFWDATTEIYADRLLYYEVTTQALATGSVQVIDRRSGSQVAADSVLYERDLGLITAQPRPHGIVLPQDTSNQEDPFHVWADLMVFHSDSLGTEMDGIGRVLIERTDLTARLERLGAEACDDNELLATVLGSGATAHRTARRLIDLRAQADRVPTAAAGRLATTSTSRSPVASGGSTSAGPATGSS